MSVLAAIALLVMLGAMIYSMSTVGGGLFFFAPLAWLGFHLYRVVVIGGQLPKDDV